MELKKTGYLLEPPSIIVPPPRFSDDDVFNLVTSSMHCPIYAAQVTIPGLCMFSKYSLDQKFRDLLFEPPSVSGELQESSYKPSFELEEDAALCMMQRLSSEGKLSPTDPLFELISPSRSQAEIAEREAYLKTTDTDSILDAFAQQLAEEENYQPSTHALYDLPFLQGSHWTESVNEEIVRLMDMLDCYIEDHDKSKDLLVLRSEKYKFTMKKPRITLGRYGKKSFVDVDISLLFPPGAKHFSRIQIVISLLDDFNFYLENVGNLPVLVNGKNIPQNKACILVNGAMIDIGGALMMVIINEKLISRLKCNRPKKSKR